MGGGGGRSQRSVSLLPFLSTVQSARHTCWIFLATLRFQEIQEGVCCVEKTLQGYRCKIMHFLFPTAGYSAIHNEIWKFENQYRGRELPGFVNYKTFESIIRQQIKTLEEPAVDMLHTIAGECWVLLWGILLPGRRKGHPKASAWLQGSPPGGSPAPASQTVL